MARIKLDLPESFAFSTDIPIRIGDINYGGHLGNDAVLSMMHEARVRFLDQHGFTEQNVDGPGIIMSDAVISYRSEAFYGETVRVEIAVADFTRTGCDLMYRLTDKETEREVARGKTGIAFFDYERRRPVAVPDGFRELFQRKQGGTTDEH
ncbi:MAG: thioesterase family protein [Candidatus Latescibacteria bacterium]|jgi:acyl-CoA thioesterase FadM|nr:thioesterase family protein [Candidatus Latescibacterota bacterium]